MDKDLSERARAISLTMAVATFLMFYVATQVPPINYYWMVLPPALFAPVIRSAIPAMRIFALIGLSVSCLVMLNVAYRALAS